jgi:hypothetical protein
MFIMMNSKFGSGALFFRCAERSFPLKEGGIFRVLTTGQKLFPVPCWPWEAPWSSKKTVPC